MVGLQFEVVPSKYQEPPHSEKLTDPQSFCEEMAFEKGREVAERVGKDKLVLSADTIGVIDGHVLEKPKDREDAKRMIRLLSGKEHTVITAVVLFAPDAEPQRKTVLTKVRFNPLSDVEIEHLLDTGEYKDKSASYAIQGYTAAFIASIEGDFFGVAGLPVAAVWEMLKPYQVRIN